MQSIFIGPLCQAEKNPSRMCFIGVHDNTPFYKKKTLILTQHILRRVEI